MKIFLFFFSFQLDTKNSPLALLAQTCSAIGSDAPNAKLMANMEKSAKAHANSKQNNSAETRDKSSPKSHSSSQSSSSSDLIAAHQIQPHHYQPSLSLHTPHDIHPQPPQAHIQPKSSFKPYESTFREHPRPTPIVSPVHELPAHTVTTTINNAHQNGRCESNQSASFQTHASPTHTSSRKTPATREHSPRPHSAFTIDAASTGYTTTSPSQDSPYYSSSKLSSDTTRDASTAYPRASATPIATTPASYYPTYSTSGGLPYTMDLMAASALITPHHSMLKAAAMNPYLNFNRLKDPSNQMMPVCRDPYCTGCGLSPHGSLQRPPCPGGCTQCDHTSANKNYPMHSHHGSVAAAYAHAQLAALAAASQLPYICNWIAGDTSYCGKRYGTSDDLLAHLRSHTALLGESMMNPAAAAAALAAGIPPNHPMFQRSYPTPPMSPLSSAGRYHPYATKPSMIPTSMGPHVSLASAMPGMQPLPNPSLAQYFSPYSYGSRMGQSHP